MACGRIVGDQKKDNEAGEDTSKEKKDDDWNDKEKNQTTEKVWTARILSES